MFPGMAMSGCQRNYRTREVLAEQLHYTDSVLRSTMWSSESDASECRFYAYGILIWLAKPQMGESAIDIRETE